MNYKKLFEDLRANRFPHHQYVLVMDNDGGYWNYIGEDSELICDKMREKMEKLYGQPNGYSDVVDILNAAGIQSEWV